MKALIVSLESFQRGEIPEEVQKYILANHGKIFTILDESSKIKTNEPCKESKKSKRTQAVMRLNRIGERCILTGTFMSKSPVNAYDQMNFLCPDFFPESIYAFAEHYVVRRALPSVRGARITLGEKDYMAVRKRLLKAKTEADFMNIAEGIKAYYGLSYADCEHIAEHEEYTPWKNVDELWNRIGDNVVKADRSTSTDIPPKVYKTYNVQLTEEQKKLYLALQNMHCTDRITVDNGLKLYLRFQDVCNGYEPVETDELNANGQHKVELIPLKSNPKLELLMELVEELGDKQAVIWCSRARLLHDAVAFMKEAGYTTAIYDGIVDKEQREKDYELFSQKKIQLMFANPRSAGYGLDGLKDCDYAIYLCNSYSVEERLQSENRCYRGIVKHSKYMIDLTCEGTVEQKVTEALKLGKELVSTGITDASLFELEE